MNFNLSPAVKYLLYANLAVYLLTLFASNADYNIIMMFGLPQFDAPNFFPTQIITHMFTHSMDMMHILGNMMGLVVFGPLLERVWGTKRFVQFYFICGIGAALIYSGVRYYEINQMVMAKEAFVNNPSFESFLSFANKANATKLFNKDFLEIFEANPENKQLVASAVNGMNEVILMKKSIPMVGASGVIFGILMAFAMYFPNTELMMLFVPFPIKAKYMVFFYGFLELSLGVVKLEGDSVAHFAHIGGAIVAFFLVRYWNSKRNTFF